MTLPDEEIFVILTALSLGLFTNVLGDKVNKCIAFCLGFACFVYLMFYGLLW